MKCTSHVHLMVFYKITVSSNFQKYTKRRESIRFAFFHANTTNNSLISSCKQTQNPKPPEVISECKKLYNSNRGGKTKMCNSDQMTKSCEFFKASNLAIQSHSNKLQVMFCTHVKTTSYVTCMFKNRNRFTMLFVIQVAGQKPCQVPNLSGLRETLPCVYFYFCIGMHLFLTTCKISKALTVQGSKLRLTGR